MACESTQNRSIYVKCMQMKHALNRNLTAFIELSTIIVIIIIIIIPAIYHLEYYYYFFAKLESLFVGCRIPFFVFVMIFFFCVILHLLFFFCVSVFFKFLYHNYCSFFCETIFFFCYFDVILLL